MFGRVSYLLAKNGVHNTYHTIEMDIPAKTLSEFFVLPEH